MARIFFAHIDALPPQDASSLTFSSDVSKSPEPQKGIMKNLVVIILCLAALGFGAFQLRQYSGIENFQTADQKADPPATPTPAPVLRAIDVDAMAARMKKHQDIYIKLRDESLQTYAKLHPVTSSYDKPAQTAIRLASYLWVWDDYYEEGLWDTYANYAAQALPKRLTAADEGDPLLNTVYDIEWLWSRDVHSAGDQTIAVTKTCSDKLEQTDYPAEFKYWGYANAIKNLAQARAYEKKSDALGKTFTLAPELADKTAHWYEELIKLRMPDDLLFAKGKALIHGLEDDEESLNLGWAVFDKSFAQYAPDSPARAALQGWYYIDYAWNARGSGYADTVSPDGWKLFGERLKKANDILETAYTNSDIKSVVAGNMITVELGQGEGRDQMEMWFQHAIADDPDDYTAYQNKLRYLLPRWYGSEQEMWNFGMECARTQNWSSKIPMILVEAWQYGFADNPKKYSMAEWWEPLEKVFHTYLEHYPESTIYRSKFAKYAAKSGHWKIAKEQFDILGDDWDRRTFKDDEYKTLLQMTASNLKSN
ncbi:MAG: hypothetical protein WCD79_14560 [Chthoniobacteraceae bacterium]